MICSSTRLSSIHAAAGVRRLVNANMCGGINVISTEKGYDLREFTLMAFGGGGSLHAVDLADELNIKKVVVPLTPGNFSAVGCQLAKVRYDYVRTIVCPTDEITVEQYNALYAEMKKEALADLLNEGFSEDKLFFSATADMRYTGQAFELNVPVETQVNSAGDFKDCAEQFARTHKRTYGYTMDDRVVFVNLRFSASAELPSLEFARHEPVNGKKAPDAALKQSRKLYFNGEFVDSAVYNRDKMPAGCEVHGPAIIEEYAASTIIPPKHTARIDEYLNIVIESD